MRCLAIAQRWVGVGGRAFLFTAAVSEDLRRRYVAEGVDVLIMPALNADHDDAARTAEMASLVNASWVVVDGYQFGSEYQERMRAHGCSLLFIDDYGHARQYFADIVVNQNISANELIYERRSAETRLLIGSKYVLLRKEFRRWDSWKRAFPEIARKILITMGGGDPLNVTEKVVSALKQLRVSLVEVRVIVGHCNQHRSTIERSLASSQFAGELCSDVAAMPELMAWADLAMTAGGSTTLETAFMGLPTIAIVTAENQRQVADCMHAKGTLVNLGWHETVSMQDIASALSSVIDNRKLRADMSAKGRALVDGLGTHRVVSEMMGSALTLRNIEATDADFLFLWANDSDVRKASFNSNPINPEEHRKWFCSKLRDSECLFFIAHEPAGKPVGQVRFDCSDGVAEVDVSVAREYRRKGFGCAIVSNGIKRLQKFRKIGCVRAYVKIDNERSIKTFLQAGFVNKGTARMYGCEAVRMEWRADDR